MLDNLKALRERLGDLGLRPHREEEIIRELSEHMADHAAVLEAHGMARDIAAQQALNSISDWPDLRKEIVAAESEEPTMNHRTKVLWLPALVALTLSNVLLALMQIFGPPTQFHWVGGDQGMGPYYVFVVPWLISQSVVGAVAAYWSRRAGGALRHQLLAALAPAIGILGLFLLILPWAMIVDEHVSHNLKLSSFLVLTVSWVLLPAIPLLIGAAPFVRKPLAQS